MMDGVVNGLQAPVLCILRACSASCTSALPASEHFCVAQPATAAKVDLRRCCTILDGRTVFTLLWSSDCSSRSRMLNRALLPRRLSSASRAFGFSNLRGTRSQPTLEIAWNVRRCSLSSPTRAIVWKMAEVAVCACGAQPPSS